MEENEPLRKRIVINLDGPKGTGAKPQISSVRQPGKGRRWPKVLAVLALLVVVLVMLSAAGGYFWWRHYQTTPAYSIALLIDAAQRNDMTSFDQRIDDDAISRNMLADVEQKVSGRYGLAINAGLQKQISDLMPKILPRVKETVHEEVATEIKEFASKSQPKPFIVVALAVPSFVNITTNGDSANASAKLNDREVELALQRDAERWKVVNVKDDVLVQHIVDSVMKEFPAIGRDTVLNLLDPSSGNKKRKR